jgi:hypothetical protein
MDLGFLDVFPVLDFRIRFDSLGCDQVSTGFGLITSGFLVAFGYRINLMILSKDKVKMASKDRIGFLG